MSLLLKALHKAGEERVSAPSHRAPAQSMRELALQPLEYASTARKPVYADPSPAQAAAMLAAGSQRASIADYARDRPLAAFAAAAMVFLMAYGFYVYLQLSPSAPSNSASRAAVVMPATQSTPRSASPLADSPAAPLPSASRMASATSRPIDVSQASPASLRKSADTPDADAIVTAALKRQPTAAAGSVAPDADKQAFADSSLADSGQEPGTNIISAPPSAPVAAAKPGKIANAGSGRIDISRETSAPKINQELADAYQALQDGRYGDAEARYKTLARAEPNNADVLLALAAIAIQQNKSEQASEYYFRILEADPKNALAQAGLIAVGGQADRQNAETRLKQLIDREPSAFLYFVLGNLYADQSQWAAAQAAYFQAHHLQPDHPDYAFNLAIGLERLSQRKLSVDYYRRALALATLRGNASFDSTTVERHVAELAAGAE